MPNHSKTGKQASCSFRNGDNSSMNLIRARQNLTDARTSNSNIIKAHTSFTNAYDNVTRAYYREQNNTLNNYVLSLPYNKK